MDFLGSCYRLYRRIYIQARHSTPRLKGGYRKALPPPRVGPSTLAPFDQSQSSTNPRDFLFLIQRVPKTKELRLGQRVSAATYCYFIYTCNGRHNLTQQGEEGEEEEHPREHLEQAEVIVELFLVILPARLLCTTSLS